MNEPPPAGNIRATHTRLIKVNGTEIEVDENLTLLQACEQAGEEIPRFCYHERLSVAGNCRMCLIEVKGGPPKPVASCAQNVRDLRVGPDGALPELYTNTPMVKKAREGVMEFLLINHPLDCPICDQGGECDLQDQAMAYGRGGSRFAENKRAVTEKHMGPLIKTVMTRCIQCTRCVRFATEIAGVDDLGLVNRGENAEITTYLEKAVESELTGNLIDICPVGALTSAPYAFNARPWELRKTETIDVMDAVGSHIRVDSRGREILRILPRLNEEINEEWIADKTRFACDGLARQRLDRPYLRKDGRLTPVTWDEAFRATAARIKAAAPSAIAALAGDLVPVEAMKALKDLMGYLGSPHLDCRQDGAVIGRGPRASYLFNAGIAGLETADAILMIGTNPRLEAPLINTRIRKNWQSNLDLPIGLIGTASDLTYGYTHLGPDIGTLGEIETALTGTEPTASGNRAVSDFARKLTDAERPALLIGMDALNRPNSEAILERIARIAAKAGVVTGDWNGYSILHDAAARVGGLDLGFLPGKDGLATPEILAATAAGDIEVLFNLGADEVTIPAHEACFVIYQGHHGDRGAHRADVIFPAAAYTEQPGLFVNTEGRVQMTGRAVFPPGEAKEDWAILRALSAYLDQVLPYDTVFALRRNLIADHPHFAQLGVRVPDDSIDSIDNQTIVSVGDAQMDAPGAETAGDRAGAPAILDISALASSVPDYYLSNAIARASKTMAECAASRSPKKTGKAA